MARHILADAFGHNVWATLVLLDECASLTPDELSTNVPGTYGSILDTLRHTVGADISYLALLSGDRVERIDEDAMDIPQLRAAMEQVGPEWERVLAEDRDPDEDVVRHRDDGIDSHAPFGVRLAQVIHHGTDHRSQICTALTSLGIEPPDIDVWAYADSVGRAVDLEPDAASSAVQEEAG